MHQDSQPVAIPSRDRRPELLRAIQHEYVHVPGLSLTEPQVRRLWDLEVDTCRELLGRLVEEGVLWRRADGAFVSRPGRQGGVFAHAQEQTRA